MKTLPSGNYELSPEELYQYGQEAINHYLYREGYIQVPPMVQFMVADKFVPEFNKMEEWLTRELEKQKPMFAREGITFPLGEARIVVKPIVELHQLKPKIPSSDQPGKEKK